MDEYSLPIIYLLFCVSCFIMYVLLTMYTFSKVDISELFWMAAASIIPLTNIVVLCLLLCGFGLSLWDDIHLYLQKRHKL